MDKTTILFKILDLLHFIERELSIQQKHTAFFPMSRSQDHMLGNTSFLLHPSRLLLAQFYGCQEHSSCCGELRQPGACFTANRCTGKEAKTLVNTSWLNWVPLNKSQHFSLRFLKVFLPSLPCLTDSCRRNTSSCLPLLFFHCLHAEADSHRLVEIIQLHFFVFFFSAMALRCVRNALTGYDSKK